MQSSYIRSKENFLIHYLEWKPQKPTITLPVICIHGNLSNARMFKWIGEELSSDNNSNPRHVVAIDIRGCGDSGMPEKGFTLHHLAQDIETVMNHLGYDKAHFIAYSRGVAYALQYALLNPNSIQGIVIGDYSTYYTRLGKEWADSVVNAYDVFDSWDSLYQSVALNANISLEQFDSKKEDYYVEKSGVIQKRFSKEFPIKLQLESEDYDLSLALKNIRGNLLILKGNEEGSLLNDEQLKLYKKYNAEVVRVSRAGHDVFEPREQVKEVIINYFNKLN